MAKQKSLFSVSKILSEREPVVKNKYVGHEFQDYGYRLACEMGEEKRKAMYIKLAKTVDRVILERARSFVIDAKKVDNRGKLFIWAVTKIRRGEKLYES